MLDASAPDLVVDDTPVVGSMTPAQRLAWIAANLKAWEADFPRQATRDITWLLRIAQASLAFQRRLREVERHPTYEAVWTLHKLHHGDYQGPTYGEELAALIAALEAAP